MLYFRSVADRTKIPLMIYNWPQATGIDIAPEAVAMLSEHPNIIAIKESSGSLEKVMQMIREVKPGFQVLVGSAPTLAPSFQVGAVGAVLAFANAAPYACITIWEAHRSTRTRCRKGLAESHRKSCAACHHQVRRSWSEARDGSDGILWRTSAFAVDGPDARCQARDRSGIRRTARMKCITPRTFVKNAPKSCTISSVRTPWRRSSPCL